MGHTNAMKKVIIVRSSQDAAGTAGYLLGDGVIVATLELPWKNNERAVSCIPDGDYVCSPNDTGAHKYYTVDNVPGRTDIEFHTGNYVKDSQGCILVGEYTRNVDGSWILYDSLGGMNKVRRFIGKNQFMLKVITL